MNTYGTKQHWIPAAVLGRFRDSQSKAKKRVRENEIIIRRRGQIGLSVNKAGAICFKKGLYDINPQTVKMYGLEPQSTTDQWDYEEGLTEIIDALVKGADLIDLDCFVHVLVPYVSGLFMRGLDYGERQENIDVIRYLRDKNTILTDNTVFLESYTCKGSWPSFLVPNGPYVRQAQESSSFKVIWDFVQRRIMAKDVGSYLLIQN